MTTKEKQQYRNQGSLAVTKALKNMRDALGKKKRKFDLSFIELLRESPPTRCEGSRRIGIMLGSDEQFNQIKVSWGYSLKRYCI